MSEGTIYDGKIQIFSEFLAALDILDRALVEELNEAPLRYDGHTTKDERKKVVDGFQSHDEEIFLLLRIWAEKLDQ